MTIRTTISLDVVVLINPVVRVPTPPAEGQAADAPHRLQPALTRTERRAWRCRGRAAYRRSISPSKGRPQKARHQRGAGNSFITGWQWTSRAHWWCPRLRLSDPRQKRQASAGQAPACQRRERLSVRHRCHRQLLLHLHRRPPLPSQESSRPRRRASSRWLSVKRSSRAQPRPRPSTLTIQTRQTRATGRPSPNAPLPTLTTAPTRLARAPGRSLRRLHRRRPLVLRRLRPSETARGSCASKVSAKSRPIRLPLPPRPQFHRHVLSWTSSSRSARMQGSQRSEAKSQQQRNRRWNLRPWRRWRRGRGR